jgi:hypothetical protein
MEISECRAVFAMLLQVLRLRRNFRKSAHSAEYRRKINKKSRLGPTGMPLAGSGMQIRIFLIFLDSN